MRLKVIVSIGLIGIVSILNAQISTDTELWTGGTFKLRLYKKFRVDLKEQFRFNDTISSMKSTFTEIGSRYKIDKHFAVKGNYRYTIKPTKNNRSRFSLDAYYNWGRKKFPLALQYRLRFQDTKVSNSGRKYTNLRNKIKVDYNLTKIVDPFLSYELYYRFNKKNEFRTWRLTAALEWRLAKKFDLTTFYRYQKEINVKNPDAQHIIGIMLTYGAKIKPKKQ